MCPSSHGLGAKYNEIHFEYFKEAINYTTKMMGTYECQRFPLGCMQTTVK